MTGITKGIMPRFMEQFTTLRVDSGKGDELITILLCPAKQEFSLPLGKTNFHSISCLYLDVSFVGT
jgi:hypothetical protein